MNASPERAHVLPEPLETEIGVDCSTIDPRLVAIQVAVPGFPRMNIDVQPSEARKLGAELMRLADLLDPPA